MVTIALDAMGGDNGLPATVGAAARTSLERNLSVLLVGDGVAVDRELRHHRYDPRYLHVQHASQWVPMHASPQAALEAHPDASILVAARLVAEGQADALVSAGNTGASVLACARHFKRLPHVPRTALAAVIPTKRRRGPHEDPFSLLLDVGATLHASADALVAFAHMGNAYAMRISRNPRPRIALLSNGSEASKGTAAIVEAHARLAADPRLHFIGNIEGVDLPHGKADVIVTDGFTGNVVLKMIEGLGETMLEVAQYAYRSRLAWRLGLSMLRGGIAQIKQITDWHQYGGAPVLGFDHLFIKAHGRSGAHPLANALKVAAKAVRSELCADIARALGDLQEEAR